MERANWKLSPSDFAFLWQECKRCFYLKVARGLPRPSAPMPKIFTRIDLLMKDFFAGKSTAELASELPPGAVHFGEQWVESEPISLPGHSATCFIRGKFDTTVKFDDGSYGVIDFKTSEAKPEHISLYGRQLHAYAYALENPAPGKLRLSPISKLGLLCVEPRQMVQAEQGDYSYLARPAWLECPRDDAAFLAFLGEVLEVVARPEPPAASEKCGWCRYRETARQTRL
jgi:hypothetical protein